MWENIVGTFLIALGIFSWGFQQGYNYAKDIALGKRKVKWSKDFMRSNSR